MTKKFLKKASCLLVVVIVAVGISGAAHAGIMADLNSLFISNNTTAMTSITTRDRVGVFGGSFTMRAPIMSVNVVAFDPPRVDAGCGGVDLYGGSFTFINSQQLIQIFRSVAANAAGLAFKAAINAISPSLGGLLQEFQTLLQNMNNLAKNTCNLAKLAVDYADKQLGNSVSGDGNTAATGAGIFSDAYSGLKTFNSNASEYFNKAGQVTPTAGNQVVKAVIASGATSILGMAGIPNVDGSADDASNPNSLNNQVIISLLGYEIAGVNCQKSNTAGVPDTSASTSNANMGKVDCSGPPLLTLDDMIKGGGGGSTRPGTPLKLYKCKNPSGFGTPDGGFDPQICTSMQTVDFSYQGVAGWVNYMLFGNGDPGLGIDPNSIIGKATSGSSYTLDANQQVFLRQSGIPLLPLLSSTSSPEFRVEIAKKLSGRVIDCVAASLGEAMYKAANGVQNSSGYVLSPDIKKNIDKLRSDYLARQDSCLNDKKLLEVITHINEATKLMSLRVR